MMNKNRVLAHVDHKNPNTFEVEDLAKLIKKVAFLTSVIIALFSPIVWCVSWEETKI